MSTRTLNSALTVALAPPDGGRLLACGISVHACRRCCRWVTG